MLTETDEVGVYTYKGCDVTIQEDDYPDSPREWDNLGTMVYGHRRYTLGDELLPADGLHSFLAERKRDRSVMLPMYLYDHSGVTMRTTPFDCPWDSGLVGYIYATPATIRKYMGVSRVSQTLRDKVEDILRGEVDTFNSFLTNDVWYYTITSPDGIESSCGGVYGYDYCKEMVVDEIDYFNKQVA